MGRVEIASLRQRSERLKLRLESSRARHAASRQARRQLAPDAARPEDQLDIFVDEAQERGESERGADELHEGLAEMIEAFDRMLAVAEQREDRIAAADPARARLVAMVEGSDDAIFGRTLDGRITSWNKGAERMYGYSAKEAIGRTLLETIPADQMELHIANFERVCRGERSEPYETTRLTKDGRALHVSVRVSPIEDERGQVVGTSAIVRDISERKRAEAALRKQNEILNNIFEHIPVMINFIGKDGRIELVNREWERTLGWSRAEIEKEGIDVLAKCCLDGRQRGELEAFIGAATGEWRDFKIRSRNGRVLETTWSETRLSDGTIIGIGADITDRKRTARQIKALHEINLALTSTLELPVVLQLLLQKIDILLPYSASHIRLIHPATGVLESLACRNIDETVWKRVTTARPGSLSAIIIASKNHVTVRNVQAEGRPTRQALYRELGLVSFLGLPLISNDEVTGILSIFTGHEHEFTANEIEFMKALANQTSIAIHNSRLYEESRKLSRDLLANREEIRRLLTGLINARDEEAERIARALHDESGQLLAAVYIKLDELARSVPAARKPIQSAKRLLDRVEQRLRNLSHNLHPTILDNLGFPAALDDLTAQISKRAEMRIAAECKTDGCLYPPLALTLYRVIQEALNNVVRHSKATRASVRVAENDTLVECDIEDNGKGFDPAALRQAGNGGLGLAGIRERVQLLNGSFEISSAPGTGTRLRIRFPKNNDGEVAKQNGRRITAGGAQPGANSHS